MNRYTDDCPECVPKAAASYACGVGPVNLLA